MTRFVEYWVDSGALQRESDAPLDPPNSDPRLVIAAVASAPGDVWNRATLLFEPVPSPPPVVVPQEVSGVVFMTQRMGLPLLAATLARESSDPMIAAFRMVLDKAEPVHLDDPSTIAGVNYLRAIGVCTDADVARILSPVT